MNPLISLIILHHNKVNYTRFCLDRLLLTRYRPLEVWLVDNGSTDGTREVLDAFAERAAGQGIRVEQIWNEDNRGAVTGRNQALQRVRGDYVAFWDNDIAVRDRDWADKLRAVLEEEKRNGIVSPKLLFPFPPYAIEFAGGAVSVGGRVQYLGRGAPREAPEYNRRREVQCVISACILIRRRLIEEVGLLDEAYNPVQYEDIDYCYRARSRGWRVLYEPTVEMYHFEHTTTAGSADLNFKYLTIRNGLRFKRRWRKMFASEGGPPDQAVQWVELPKKGVEEIGELPVV